MLLLNAKKHSKIYIGEGDNEVVVMLSDVVVNPDGSVIAKLAFDAPKHICIDRESVRRQRRAKVDKVVQHANAGVINGNPKD